MFKVILSMAAIIPIPCLREKACHLYSIEYSASSRRAIDFKVARSYAPNTCRSQEAIHIKLSRPRGHNANRHFTAITIITFAIRVCTRCRSMYVCRRSTAQKRIFQHRPRCKMWRHAPLSLRNCHQTSPFGYRITARIGKTDSPVRL